MLNVLKKLRVQLYDVIQAAHEDGRTKCDRMSEDTEAARDRVVALFVHTMLDCVEMGRDMGRKDAEADAKKGGVTSP